MVDTLYLTHVVNGNAREPLFPEQLFHLLGATKPPLHILVIPRGTTASCWRSVIMTWQNLKIKIEGSVPNLSCRPASGLQYSERDHAMAMG